MVAVRDRVRLVEEGGRLPARDAPPGRLQRSIPGQDRTARTPHAARPAKQAATGVVLLVQEGRLRLLTTDGRGCAFLLSPEAAIEPQDIASLPGCRVRLWYHAAPKLMAGVVTDIEILA